MGMELELELELEWGRSEEVRFPVVALLALLVPWLRGEVRLEANRMVRRMDWSVGARKVKLGRRDEKRGGMIGGALSAMIG